MIGGTSLPSRSHDPISPYALRTGFPNVGMFYTAKHASGSAQFLPLAALVPKRGIVIQILLLLNGRR